MSDDANPDTGLMKRVASLEAIVETLSLRVAELERPPTWETPGYEPKPAPVFLPTPGWIPEPSWMPPTVVCGETRAMVFDTGTGRTD